MKKKYLILSVILFITVHAYAQLLGSYDYERTKHISFKEDNLFYIYDYEISSKPLKKGIYSLRTIHNCDYLYLKYEDEECKKFLCLHNEEMIILYSEKDLEPFLIGYSSNNLAETITYINDKEIHASSFLTEGNKNYRPENITKLALDSPWIESAKGHGENEYVEIDNWSSLNFIFFSGYVSYSKPYLYTDNARPKTIEIEEIASGKKRCITLKDTPNPQIVKFDLNNRIRGKIRITIKDVYKGEKYSDMCLNCIMER